MSDYNEASFENTIELFLTSEEGGYRKRDHTAFDRDLCFDTEVFVEFIQSTQPETWSYLENVHKANASKVLVDDLVRALNSDHEGALKVLRHGFKCFGKLVNAAYFQPASGLNPETQRLYQANILTITRQARYSTKHNNSVDILLTANGIPVVTMELKNPLTGQTWRNAIHQYKHDRDPSDILFSFKKRAAVHFAVDTDEAYMATRLSGRSSRFLPFNKGNSDGAGNPENPDGYKTAYLWEQVLQRDSLLDIIARFLHLQTKEEKVGDKIIKKEMMIFPRYHQLTCVRQLIDVSREEGAGHNYLIQHSAGSGKSNSIAWVAHRLSSLHDDDDDKVFHSVIVVTDRLVLDQQLQNTIYQFEHKAGVVNKIETDSNALADALNTGSPIVITTLQKFPFVLDKVGDLGKKRYAVIVDEAHSSMGGQTATEMKGALGAKSADPDAEEPSSIGEEQEEIIKAMNRRGPKPNLSFFAFTATPKYKTLEVFGRPGVDGKPEPFHLYSMRQAIEEGFILDVLQNYTTYKTYWRLVKAVEDDPKVDKRKAAAALARFVSLHSHNIAQRTEVMVEHFRQHTRHRIGAKGKAMVVARSRLHAVRYKEAIDRYIKEKGYGLKTLVAFSGTVTDPDTKVEFTEVHMNDGIKEKELPSKFTTDEYSVLIVAEKYQTGFDEPLLHTMYVDRRLGGIQAIQTLSRLNRTHPGKEDTFVLDFVNTEEDIQRAFQPYYETTIVGEQVDYQKLYELQAKLDGFQIYYPEEIEQFSKVFFDPRTSEAALKGKRINAALDPAVDRFKEQEEADQEEFRSTVVSFLNVYSFLAQIIPFQDSDLEKLYSYLRLLRKKLPRKGRAETFDLEDDVALKYYRLQKISEGSIELKKGEEAPVEAPTDVGTRAAEAQEEELSRIIDVLNEKFKTDFTPADELFIDSVREDAVRDQKVRDAAKNNTMENFEYVFLNKVDNLFVDRMEQNESITAKFLNEPDFKKAVTTLLVKKVYDQIREEMGISA